MPDELQWIIKRNSADLTSRSLRGGHACRACGRCTYLGRAQPRGFALMANSDVFIYTYTFAQQRPSNRVV
jgi:hypothetical protein